MACMIYTHFFSTLYLHIVHIYFSEDDCHTHGCEAIEKTGQYHYVFLKKICKDYII